MFFLTLNVFYLFCIISIHLSSPTPPKNAHMLYPTRAGQIAKLSLAAPRSRKEKQLSFFKHIRTEQSTKKRGRTKLIENVTITSREYDK